MSPISDSLQQLTPRDGPGADRCVPSQPLRYLLCGWPDLPDRYRRARIYQALSHMTVRPLDRSGLLARLRMSVNELDELLDALAQQKLIDVLPACK